MSINVKLVYVRDQSSSKISSVPLNCTILKIKDILKQINKMDSIETIRVVHKGTILPDERLIGDLISGDQKELTLFVTGITTIPSKIPTQKTTKATKKTTNKAKQAQLDKNGKDVNQRKPKNSYIILFLAITFILTFSFMLIKIIYFDPSEHGLPIDDVKLECSKKSVVLGIIFIDFILISIAMLITFYANFNTIFRYIYLFFISLLPIFDYDEFKKEKEIQHN